MKAATTGSKSQRLPRLLLCCHQERSQEVLHDDAVTATRDPQSFDKLRQIAPDRDDVSALPGNIDSDPMATPTPRQEHRCDHGYLAIVCTKPAYPLCFLIGQQLSEGFNVLRVSAEQKRFLPISLMEAARSSLCDARTSAMRMLPRTCPPRAT